MQPCCAETQANASDVLVTKLRTIWIADAHRDNGKRYVVHADEKLTAFMELESAVRAAANCID
jgi:hypothetical protein